MTNTNNAALDNLTTASTSFGSWAEMVAAAGRGYRPTVSRGSRRTRLLGRALEAAGHSVFWRD